MQNKKKSCLAFTSHITPLFQHIKIAKSPIKGKGSSKVKTPITKFEIVSSRVIENERVLRFPKMLIFSRKNPMHSKKTSPIQLSQILKENIITKIKIIMWLTLYYVIMK